MSEMCFKDVNDSEVKSELRFVDTRSDRIAKLLLNMVFNAALPFFPIFRRILILGKEGQE